MRGKTAKKNDDYIYANLYLCAISESNSGGNRTDFYNDTEDNFKRDSQSDETRFELIIL